MGDNQPCIVAPIQKTYAIGNGQVDQTYMQEKVGTLNCMHDQQAVMVPHIDTIGALCARDYKGVGSQYVDEGECITQNYSVRRLTPLECERLQGFPDGWTDIPGQTEASKEELEFWREVWFTWDKTQAEDPEKVKPRTDNRLLRWLKNPVSDSAQYKALGNSVAVPCPEYVIEGISEVLRQDGI
jgi:site-specific DNA-cytosine methylase